MRHGTIPHLNELEVVCVVYSSTSFTWSKHSESHVEGLPAHFSLKCTGAVSRSSGTKYIHTHVEGPVDVETEELYEVPRTPILGLQKMDYATLYRRTSTLVLHS